MIKPFYFLAFVFLSTQCTVVSETNKSIDSKLQLVYTVDREGLFLYDLKTGKERKIYTTDQKFMDKKMQFLNDSIFIVAHKSKRREEEKERLVYSKYMYRADGDSTFITNNPPYKTVDKYWYVTETYFAVNINTSIAFKYKTIDYEYLDYELLNIKTTRFDTTGQIVESMPITSEGTNFEERERYFSASEQINQRQIFSRQGNLYLVEREDTSMLLKFNGNFEPKFGSGYYNPALSPDGKKVTYQYLAGFLSEGSAMFEMSIQTKKKKELLDAEYFRPVYSPDGNKLAVAKNQRQAKGEWINSIYIYDLRTGKIEKATDGNTYFWRPLNNLLTSK